MSKVQPIPAGYHTITPVLTVSDTRKAIDFYKEALGAEEREICLGPDGKKIMHAEIKIGDSIIMINDEFPEMGCRGPKTLGGTAVTMYLYVNNVDEMFARATRSGAVAMMPPADMFWGDRFSQIEDPFGHRWSISTHVADPTPEQIKKGQEEWAKKEMACANK